MQVLPGATKSNTALAWSPCGRFVVAGGSGDGVTVWDVVEATPGERVLTAGHGGEEMRFCPRTGRLYVAFRTGGFWTYDPDAGEERKRLPNNHATHYHSAAVSADGTQIVLRRYVHSSYPGEHSLVGFAVAEDGTLLEVWSRTVGNGSGDDRYDLTFLPGTPHLIGRRGNWHLTNAFEWIVPRTGELVGSLPLANSVRVSQWVLSPDGSRVAWLAEQDLHIQRFDERLPRVLPASAGESRRGLAWSPDGRTLAFTCGSAVRLFDADTFTEVRAFDWRMGKARAVCFSPDGLRAAVSAEGGKGWVTVFDLE
jgi:WD40 repeat protein